MAEIELKGHIEIRDEVIVRANDPSYKQESRHAVVIIDEQPEMDFPMSWRDGQKVRLPVEVVQD